MKKPEDFLLDVWEKLSTDEKKEVYLNSIITDEKAPPYLYGLIDEADAPLDDKINIAEKILNGEELTTREKRLVNYDIVD